MFQEKKYNTSCDGKESQWQLFQLTNTSKMYNHTYCATLEVEYE